jgi:hypothetical protein
VTDLPGLLACQNPDGGWPYRGGGSWTEPTVYALLALATTGEVSSSAVSRALLWLQKLQRQDGGWPPRESVEQSTWVTALVLLLPVSMLARINTAAALKWLASKTGRESSRMQRAREALISGRVDRNSPEGWPWFPDTAAWVAPTSISILALSKAWKRDPREELQDRIQQGRKFLAARVCADGGWNHGSSKALGYDGPSYPETTGLALLALKSSPGDVVARGVERAEMHLRAAVSLEAICWLQLGLLAQQRRPLNPQGAPQRALSTQEIALVMIARGAMRGMNVLDTEARV